MKHICLLFLLLSIVIQTVSGQDNPQRAIIDTTTFAKHPVEAERRWGDGGVGIGLDYGGLIGVRASFYPVSYMGIFAACGWELIGIGWNAGCLGRLFPADGKHGVRPYLKVMYGVNAATKVTGRDDYDKMFYGVTAGIGLEVRFGRAKKNGLNLDLNVPFRSPEYFAMVDRMKRDPMVKMNNSTLPIAISLGYVAEF
jgi:hypothetical protein